MADVMHEFEARYSNTTAQRPYRSNCPEIYSQYGVEMAQRQNSHPEASHPPVTSGLARNEIERLFSDKRLHLSKRNRAFLQYLADQYYLGNHRRVKAYAIAIDVFGRSADFDPAQDPIVRIEAARLRAELERYYDTYVGCSDVRVDLPRGYYVAEFSHVGDVGVQRRRGAYRTSSDLSADGGGKPGSLRALAVSSTYVLGWPFQKLAAAYTQLRRNAHRSH
jgi:hypothetical protein